MNSLFEQKTPNVKTLAGDIILDGQTYKLKTERFGFWIGVNVDKLTPSKDGSWHIKANAVGKERESKLDQTAIDKIFKNVGKDKIELTDKEGNKYKLVKEEKMQKTIKLTESDLTNIIKKVLKEQSEENYMFFSNLEQMKRQIDMLLELDPHLVDEIIQNGHDWADDHVSEAKTNMDQVFDFMMNETRKMKSYIDYEDISEGTKKSGTKLCSRGKAAAKSKFKVYPSAYANGYAVQVCKGKMPGLDGKKHCSGSYC